MNCQYCGRECKNKNSLVQHEVRCKANPDHIECFGNKGHMPEHCKKYLNKKIYKNGQYIGITLGELNEYKLKHQTCEICGKTVKESVKWVSKFAPKNLCVDHDHNTNLFRGLLCSTCNRQLGWYEKYKNEIDNYLNKGCVV